MICLGCGELVDETTLFIGIYADVGRWETGDEEDVYATETSKYLAVLHIECLKDCPMKELTHSIEREMAEFKRRVESSFRDQYRGKSKPKFAVFEGGKV